MPNTNTYDPLRPRNLSEYVGQTRMKQEVGIALNAARIERRPCRQTLLIAPPGMGKTSLAGCMAAEIGLPLNVVMCPFEPHAVMRALRTPQLLFFDEIHRTRKAEQESLLSLIEDGVMYIGRRAVEAKNVSIVAATTEPQKLLNTITDRFVLRPAFDDYTDDEMSTIVAGMFARVDLSYSRDDCALLGRAAAGVPRTAKSFVMTAQDMAIVNKSKPSVDEILQIRRVRPDGLSVEHCRYLWLLFNQDGRASLALISAALGMPQAAIQQVENLLVKKALINVTPRGRALSDMGWEFVDDNPEPKEANTGV